MSDFTFCGDWNRDSVCPKRPIRVLVITSVRDTGVEDKNGQMVETRTGTKYMEGAIERLVLATFPGKLLHGIIEVVGIVTDDLPEDLKGTDYYVMPHMVMPKMGKPWITPFDLKTPKGQLVTTLLTQNIPSDFRALHRADINGRQERKHAFEERIANLMRFFTADVLLSDHYMAKMEYLIVPESERGFGLFGKVLNIHPAVTVDGHPHCFRGKTPTADAIERAQSGVATMTGATLHLIDPEIDHGPPIAYTAPTLVYANDKPQWLRWRNYQGAKLPLLVAGLHHYALRIFPHLADGLNLNALIADKAA